MMRRPAGAVLLFLTLFLIWTAKGTQPGPPGKPTLTSCRSPDKETFSCWWEPGPDGGLPAMYALYFRKENSEKVYECTDYITAGRNSCFFNKNETSIWIDYNITVVATNSLGSTSSDPVDVDVVYIVQPHTPENVKVQLMEDTDGPFLRVSWEPPHKADTRSGWITLVYELRVSLEGEEEWEEHRAGHQKMFNIFSLRSGGLYQVQVRCKPDHGFWSEWSTAAYIKVPDYIPQERSVWTLIVVFSAAIFLILTWILILKSHKVKHFLLPPVPGPKIKGFDEQLLKSGSSDEVFSALVLPGIQPTSSDREDLLVDYLEVYACGEQELSLDLDLAPKGSRCESDFGQGTHTLLLEKSGESEAGQRRRGGAEVGSREATDPDWPAVFPPPPHYTSIALDQWGSTETAPPVGLPQICTRSHPAQLGYSTKEELAGAMGEGCREPHRVCTQAVQPYWAPHCGHSGLGSPAHRSTEYVEVQRVHQGELVILQGLSVGRGGREEYSRVKGVDGSTLLLAPTDEVEDEVEEQGEEGRGSGGTCRDVEGEGEYCYTTSCHAGERKVSVTLREDPALTGGYVDTAAIRPRY